jgi:hypothetical protein
MRTSSHEEASQNKSWKSVLIPSMLAWPTRRGKQTAIKKAPENRRFAD